MLADLGVPISSRIPIGGHVPIGAGLCLCPWKRVSYTLRQHCVLMMIPDRVPAHHIFSLRLMFSLLEKRYGPGRQQQSSPSAVVFSSAAAALTLPVIILN